MYFFFSEFNKTARVDEEPYRARIGRVCTVRTVSPFLHLTRDHQVAAFTLATGTANRLFLVRSWCVQVDEGGIKALLADSWTTFMKARVMCGAGNTQQQYNNLKQAVVLTAQDRRAGVLYGLFSNAW